MSLITRCAAMSLPAQVTAAELHPNGAVETGERSGASELIAPHGGTLVDRQLVGEPLLAARAALPGLRHIELDLRAFADLECIATGVYSPLSGFMGAADYRSVLSEMRLANGLPWSIPITLSIAQDAAEGISAGSQIALTWRSQPLALMRVDDRFAVDLHEEAVQVYGTADTDHPGVAALMGRGGLYLGGPISLIDRLPAREFADLRLTPSQTRAEFRRRGWRSIVAFQTRNPIHRAHEYLQKTALEAVDGLFVNPLVGATKDDDVPAAVRMQSYQVILERYYPAQRTLLGVFPAAMRYAGPREAILHALARKNYGCTHGGGKHTEQRPLRRVVAFEDDLIALHTHRRGHVIVLRSANERIHEQAIDRFQRRLLQVFVCAMNRVARLEGDDAAPAASPELGAGLARGKTQVRELSGGQPIDERNRTAKIESASAHQRSNAGVVRVRRAVDLHRLFMEVNGEAVIDTHQRQRLGTPGQGNLTAGRDSLRRVLRDGERDGDRPRQTVGKPHLAQYGAIIRCAHEAAERRVDAGGDALQVGKGSEVKLYMAEAGQRRACGEQWFTDELAVNQRAAVRRDQLRGARSLAGFDGAVGVELSGGDLRRQGHRSAPRDPAHTYLSLTLSIAVHGTGAPCVRFEWRGWELMAGTREGT